MSPSRPDVRSVAGLRDIQRRMAGAIFRPLTAERRTLPRWRDGRRMTSFAAEFIKPNDRLTSLERLEIYNRTYWFRVIDCFYDDFPGLRAVMGQRRFDAFTEAYLTECPSRSFTLRDLGSRVEWFLNRHPQWTQPRPGPRLVLDMARFEWAQVVAFDEGARPALSSGDLLGQDPRKLRVGLQPYITLLKMAYPLDDFLLAVKRDQGATDGAANAVGKQSENQARRPRRKVRSPQPAETFLAVHRHENSLYYKRLEPHAFALLKLLGEGKPLGSACEIALRDVEGGQEQWMAKVRGWFENWMRMGWFCSVKKIQNKNIAKL